MGSLALFKFRQCQSRQFEGCRNARLCIKLFHPRFQALGFNEEECTSYIVPCLPYLEKEIFDEIFFSDILHYLNKCLCESHVKQ